MKLKKLLFPLILVTCIFSSCEERELKHNGSVILSSTVKELNLRDYLQLYQGSEVRYNGRELPSFQNNSWDKLPWTEMCFGLFIKDKWVKVKFLANEEFHRSLFIDCVMIPEVDIFLQSNKKEDVAIFAGSTRDRTVLSHQIPHGYTVDWQFEPGEVLECYIRFDGKGWASQPIISLFDSMTLFSETTNRSHYLFAFRLSVFIISIVVICLYILSKKDSFLFYAFMMLGSILYVETEMGLYQRVLNIDHYYVSYYVRNICNVIYYYFLFRFIKSNLENENEDWLKAKTVIRYIIYVQTALFILVLFFNQTIAFFPSVLSLISIIFTILVLSYLVIFLTYKSFKGIVRARYFFFIYFFSTNVVTFVFALPHIGFVPRLSEQVNIICAVFFFEFMIFLVITIVDAWKITVERNKLLEERKAKERNIAFALISGQESERNRIGRELHDAIGGNLASAKQKINDQNYLDKILNETLQLVRTMSHGLVIPSITGLTFKEEIEDLAMRFSNQDMKVQIIFHLWPDHPKDENLGHLYRISQELLQNASKHSRASQVFLQFLGGENYQLSYEDNGIGFDPHDHFEGLGWKNIHFRVQAMSAAIKIESSQQAGTTIAISHIALK